MIIVGDCETSQCERRKGLTRGDMKDDPIFQLLVPQDSLLGYLIYWQNFLNHFGSNAIFYIKDNELDNIIHYRKTKFSSGGA